MQTANFQWLSEQNSSLCGADRQNRKKHYHERRINADSNMTYQLYNSSQKAKFYSQAKRCSLRGADRRRTDRGWMEGILKITLTVAKLPKTTKHNLASDAMLVEREEGNLIGC